MIKEILQEAPQSHSVAKMQVNFTFLQSGALADVIILGFGS